jgi:hypothetical protein
MFNILTACVIERHRRSTRSTSGAVNPAREATVCGQHGRFITMLDTDILICEYLSWLLSAFICDERLFDPLLLTLAPGPCFTVTTLPREGLSVKGQRSAYACRLFVMLHDYDSHCNDRYSLFDKFFIRIYTDRPSLARLYSVQRLDGWLPALFLMKADNGEKRNYETDAREY